MRRTMIFSIFATVLVAILGISTVAGASGQPLGSSPAAVTVVLNNGYAYSIICGGPNDTSGSLKVLSLTTKKASTVALTDSSSKLSMIPQSVTGFTLNAKQYLGVVGLVKGPAGTTQQAWKIAVDSATGQPGLAGHSVCIFGSANRSDKRSCAASADGKTFWLTSASAQSAGEAAASVDTRTWTQNSSGTQLPMQYAAMGVTGFNLTSIPKSTGLLAVLAIGAGMLTLGRKRAHA